MRRNLHPNHSAGGCELRARDLNIPDIVPSTLESYLNEPMYYNLFLEGISPRVLQYDDFLVTMDAAFYKKLIRFANGREATRERDRWGENATTVETAITEIRQYLLDPATGSTVVTILCNQNGQSWAVKISYLSREGYTFIIQNSRNPGNLNSMIQNFTKGLANDVCMQMIFKEIPAWYMENFGNKFCIHLTFIFIAKWLDGN